MIILDKDHVYHLPDGRTPPGVSRVLDLYFPPSGFYTEEGRVLGTSRHKWFHELVKGKIIKNEPDERIAGEVAAFRRFMYEVKPVYVSGEVPYHDPVLDVCGKPDLVAKISGRLGVIDFKPPTKNKRTIVQLAAYALMLRRNTIPVMDRFELRLGDGNYRLEKHEDPGDIKRWECMVPAWKAVQFYK